MTLFQTLYDAGPNGHWIYLLVTVILGGGTAYVTGRSIAETWRPFWQALAYVLLLGLVVRFIHFALYEEVLVSIRNYLVDIAVLAVLAIVGYLIARRGQMLVLYGWRAAGR